MFLWSFSDVISQSEGASYDYYIIDTIFASEMYGIHKASPIFLKIRVYLDGHV